MADRTDIIVLYDITAFSAPIEYTFDLLLSTLGARYKIIPLNEFKPEEYKSDEVLIISYGQECPAIPFKRHIHIYSSNFFGDNYFKPSSMPKTPLTKYDSLPIIYAGSGRLDGWVKRSENLIETNIDIIASSFFMVSRYEEVIIDAKDGYGRFPATASLAYQNEFLDRPVVNEYIELLRGWISALAPGSIKKPVWPEGKEFAVCLTHDVDFPNKYSALPPVFRFGSLVKQRKPLQAINIGLEYPAVLFRLKKDPYDTFDYMLDLERKYGYKSSFYFMAEGSSYSLVQTRLKKIIERIQGQGSEAGLHGGYDSYTNFDQFNREKKEMEKAVSNKDFGCRQHFLRWKTPDTWRIQEKAGILYDTTLSYADQAGFRCGFCLPFKPFDVLENRVLNIWELPLIVMEGSLQNPNYQSLPPEKAYHEIIRLCDTVKKYNGVFVLLWHNSSFDSNGGWEGWQAVYEKALNYIGGQDAWSATGRDVINRYKQKTGATHS